MKRRTSHTNVRWIYIDLPQLGKEVTRAVRYDDKKFFEDLLQLYGRPS